MAEALPLVFPSVAIHFLLLLGTLLHVPGSLAIKVPHD